MEKIKILAPLFSIILFACWVGAAQTSSSPMPCMTCDELKNLGFPEVRIVETESVSEDGAYCKVLGVIGKEINFELLLPDRWNARFVMGGGGGFVGSIQNSARGKVREGYATAGTDTGHQGPGVKADWAQDNMERQLNFGHLAVHRTAVVSKAIIGQYYCSAPEYNYFMGCSRGGGQAMIEAQRYPEDFDGIVAAAPILDWPATGAEGIQNIQALYPDPAKIDEPPLSVRHIQILQNAILAQCDELDGLKDDILNDPRACDPDLSALPRCPDGKSGEDCFTSAQIKIIETIYDGVSNQNGPIYPGFPVGCESEPGGWIPWITGPNPGTMRLNFPSLHFGFGTEMYKHLILNDPDWDYATYDFSNYEEDTRFARAYLNATSTDYSGFKAAGAKLLIWHGWNDPALSALTIIDHYEAAKKENEDMEDFIRLFMLPGVLHCAGGPGPSEADWLEIVRAWVEQGKAPERVIVSKTKDGEVTMTRPVYPYPKTAVYDGDGDPNRAENFVEKKD